MSGSLDDLTNRHPKPGEHILCWACRRTGRCQLGITKFEPGEDERSILVHATCPAEWEGGPQVAHGGWTAATFDEAMGQLPLLLGGLTVTGTLTIQYVKPVPIERPVELRCRVDRVEGRRWYVKAEMTLAATGAVLGRADGVFVQRNPAHFENHQKWMQEQDASSRT